MNYFIKFVNKTKMTRIMGVYQEAPKDAGLTSVTWKKATAPNGGYGTVNWNETYGATLSDFIDATSQGLYENAQYLESDLGTTWVIKYDDQYAIQYLEKSEHHDAGDRQIVIRNESGEGANPGFGIDGATSLVKSDVISGDNQVFDYHPVYYVSLFHDVVIGEVISEVTKSDAHEIQFKGRDNLAIVTADDSSGALEVSIDYGKRSGAEALELIHEAQMSAGIAKGEGLLTFKAGNGVASNEVVEFSKTVSRHAEEVCKGIVKQMEEQRLKASWEKRGDHYFIYEGGGANIYNLETQNGIETKINISSKHIPQTIDALNRFFANWRAVGGLIAVGATYGAYQYLMHVQHRTN